MAEHLHFDVLYQGALVSIRDVRCRPAETGCGAEENRLRGRGILVRRRYHLSPLRRFRKTRR
jgi:hypothetical protein